MVHQILKKDRIVSIIMNVLILTYVNSPVFKPTTFDLQEISNFYVFNINLLKTFECRHFVSGYEIRGLRLRLKFQASVNHFIFLLRNVYWKLCFRKSKVYRKLRYINMYKKNLKRLIHNQIKENWHLFLVIIQDVHILNTEPGCIIRDWSGKSKLKYMHW